MDKKNNLQWRISQKKSVLDSMTRELGKTHGDNQAADAVRIQQVKKELADLKQQLAEVDRPASRRSDFLPSEPGVKKAQVASSFLPPPRVSKLITPQKPTEAELGLNPILMDGPGWLKKWRAQREPSDLSTSFLNPEEPKKSSLTDLGLNPIVSDSEGWKQAWYRKQEADERAKKDGPYKFDTASIFNSSSDMGESKPDGWLYGTNSGVESKPKPIPKPLVPTPQNTKNIVIGTRYGKVGVTAPAWKDMSLDEKVQFRNYATKEAEDYFEKHGYKPFRGHTLPLTPPSEHTPYAGDFMTDLQTAEGMADGVTKVGKLFSPLSQIDSISGGRITKLLRSAADRIKVVPDEPDDPEVPWVGKVLENTIEPGHIVAGLLNYPSTIVESAADTIDPNSGAIRSTLGAANLIPFVHGTGKNVRKGFELLRPLKPFRQPVLTPEARVVESFHHSFGNATRELPRPIREVKAILRGHEPIPPIKTTEVWSPFEVKQSQSPLPDPLVKASTRQGEVSHETLALNQRLETRKRNLDHFTGLIDTTERDTDYSPLLGGHPVKKISPEKIKSIKPNGSMIGIDGHIIEIHHGPNGFEEMTRTEHRLGSNFLKNHPGGKGPGKYDEALFEKFKRKYKLDPWHQTRLVGGN